MKCKICNKEMVIIESHMKNQVWECVTPYCKNDKLTIILNDESVNT